MFESSQTLYKVNARYFEHVPRTTVEDSYLNAPLHNVYLRVQSDVTDKERVGELGVARIHSNFIEDRNTFLRLPSREEGLNMDRVRTYSQRMGLPYVSIRCLTLTEYQRARAQTIVQLSSVTDADLATYHNALDVITAKRGLEQEILNGPELIESFIVHELAHSTSK